MAVEGTHVSPTLDLPARPSRPVKAIPVLDIDGFKLGHTQCVETDSPHNAFEFFTVIVAFTSRTLHDELPFALGLGSPGGHLLDHCVTLQQFHGRGVLTGRRAGGGGHPGRGE